MIESHPHFRPIPETFAFAHVFFKRQSGNDDPDYQAEYENGLELAFGAMHSRRPEQYWAELSDLVVGLYPHSLIWVIGKERQCYLVKQLIALGLELGEVGAKLYGLEQRIFLKLEQEMLLGNELQARQMINACLKYGNLFSNNIN